MAPSRGALREFTVCIETRPMLAFNEHALDMFQEQIQKQDIWDPVCCYDEADGTISVFAQIDAGATHLAAQRAAHAVQQALVSAGLTTSLDVIEKLTAEEYRDESDVVIYNVEAAT